jgi:phosphotransferase system enzyme I (PtsP)
LLYDRYDFISPPVLDILEQLACQANAAGVPVSLCGEVAGRPLEALVLAALGVTTLSMPASGILPLKAMFSQVDLAAVRSVLSAIRRGGDSGLRGSVATWAREQGILG